MDKLKLDIQRFAATPPTAGNLIDEVCLHEYHQNIERDYVKNSSLATVATTGDYDDLTNKPTIPSLSGLIYTDVVTLASNLSVNANTNTATATYTLSPTSGYTAVMVTLENVYNGAINLWYCHLEDNKIAWRVRNVSNSNATGVSIRVAVLYVKTELVV